MPLLRRLAVLALVLIPSGLRAQDEAALTGLVDRTLARLVASGGAGCTVGLHVGSTVVTRGVGFADLERRSPMTASTIIEAGSVSKQFTAAAVVLLARDGKLGLDDDVRRWFPELPVYDAPITVRHLLTHTSGLRDWGAIVALEGWPRGARAHTNAHVVLVASRQRALNYTPGATYAYTNTGYNLLAVLVERVSGQSLAAFTAERLFAPLGMTSTSWRDQYTRIVPSRALAYSAGTTPTTDMPNENAYGNGGLLTTAADLVRWTTALNSGALGVAFTDQLTQRMIVTNGDTIDYALGVNVLSHRGTRELSHSGATGGYRAHLLAFPDRRAGVGVLCNGGGLNASQIAETIADSVIGPRSRRAVTAVPGRAPRPVRMTATPGGTFPSATALQQLIGEYASAEVGGEPYQVVIEGGALVLRQAPSLRLILLAAANGRFQAGGRVVWFDHDASGRATTLHVGQDRAWDVAFTRK
jgi:CubicO group peptidase (beta-lactamase class C family)